MKPNNLLTASKLPPFGKPLIERQRFKNPPDFVFIFAGVQAWNEAKRLQTRGDIAALVLPPETSPAGLIWPVRQCDCILSWNVGPSEDLIIELVRALLRSGAASVTTWPRWVDYKQPAVRYDESGPVGKRWVQARELIRVYRPREAKIAAA